VDRWIDAEVEETSVTLKEGEKSISSDKEIEF